MFILNFMRFYCTGLDESNVIVLLWGNHHLTSGNNDYKRPIWALYITLHLPRPPVWAAVFTFTHHTLQQVILLSTCNKCWIKAASERRCGRRRNNIVSACGLRAEDENWANQTLPDCKPAETSSLMQVERLHQGGTKSRSLNTHSFTHQCVCVCVCVSWGGNTHHAGAVQGALRWFLCSSFLQRSQG